jgi:hypothetical protein
MQAWLFHREIQRRLAQVLEKYKDVLPPLPQPDKKTLNAIRRSDICVLDYTQDDDIVPIRLKALLYEPASPEEEKNPIDIEIKPGDERNEYEALEAAVLDLIRLDRYERRAWSG